MSRLILNQNDTGPAITATLSNASGALDLTGATVRFKMRRRETFGTPQIDAPATIVAATAGQVLFAWRTGDTAISGEYEATWKVTFLSGLVQTFPAGDPFVIQIDRTLP